MITLSEKYNLSNCFYRLSDIEEQISSINDEAVIFILKNFYNYLPGFQTKTIRKFKRMNIENSKLVISEKNCFTLKGNNYSLNNDNFTYSYEANFSCLSESKNLSLILRETIFEIKSKIGQITSLINDYNVNNSK